MHQEATINHFIKYRDSCLHAEVAAFAEALRAGRRSGTQACPCIYETKRNPFPVA